MKTPAFRAALATARADPNVVRDMVTIARHRGWCTVAAQGSRAFRRKAWMTGSLEGLQVRYRSSARDRQELARRLERSGPPRATRTTGRAREVSAGAPELGRLDPMAMVERVVRTRLADPAAQNRVLARARARLAHWLEREGHRDGASAPPRRDDPRPRRERQR